MAQSRKDATEAEMGVIEDLPVEETQKEAELEEIKEVEREKVQNADRPLDRVQERIQSVSGYQKDVSKKHEQVKTNQEMLLELLDDEDVKEYLDAHDKPLLRVIRDYHDRVTELLFHALMSSQISTRTLMQTEQVIDDQQRAHDERYIMDNFEDLADKFTQGVKDVNTTAVEQIQNNAEMMRDTMSKSYNNARKQEKITDNLARTIEEMNKLAERFDIKVENDEGVKKERIHKFLDREDDPDSISNKEVAEIVGCDPTHVSKVRDER